MDVRWIYTCRSLRPTSHYSVRCVGVMSTHLFGKVGGEAQSTQNVGAKTRSHTICSQGRAPVIDGYTCGLPPAIYSRTLQHLLGR